MNTLVSDLMNYTHYPSKEETARVAEILITAHPSLGARTGSPVGIWPNRLSSKFDQLRFELRKTGSWKPKPIPGCSEIRTGSPISGIVQNPDSLRSPNVRSLDTTQAPHSSSSSQSTGNLRGSQFPTKFVIPRWPPLLESTLSSSDAKCRESGQKFEPPKKILTEMLGALTAEIFKYTYYPTDDNVKVRIF